MYSNDNAIGKCAWLVCAWLAIEECMAIFYDSLAHYSHIVAKAQKAIQEGKKKLSV